MHNMLYIKDDNFNQRQNSYTTNLQKWELIHMYFAFYNLTSIGEFTSMCNILCENTLMLWVFPIAYKRGHLCIISLILTTLEN